MKYLFWLFLIVTTQFSCKNQVFEAFENLNQSILDSIALYDALSDRLFKQLDPNSLRMRKAEGEFSALAYYGLKEQNKSIDSLIQLISSQAVNLSDRAVCTKYLVKSGKAEEIRQSLNSFVLYMEAESPFDLPEQAKQMIWSINDTDVSDDRSWAEYKFHNMPLVACKPILNKFKFNNSKASALILLDLKERIIHNASNNIDYESE